MSEVFLIGWAVIATVLAIVFKHFLYQSNRSLLVFKLGVALVAEGKATVVKNGDNIQIRSV